MGNRNAFVTPEIIRRALPDSELWVELKAELSYGEKQRLTGALMTSIQRPGAAADAVSAVDLEGWHVLRLLTWLVDWNFEDANGKRVEITRAAVVNLRPEIGEAVDAIIDAYIEELEAKKVRG